MKFAFFGYRKWAEKILNGLRNTKSDVVIHNYTTKDTEYSHPEVILETPSSLAEIDFNIYSAVFFYGWSWIVPEYLVKNIDCICLHPSPLPKYRGGSPIQNQIINGEGRSAISLFKMSDGLDNGPVCYQEPFSLDGELPDIFSKISLIGTKLTKKLINDYISDKTRFVPQDEKFATSYKRRKPSESELTKNMIERMSDKDIYNFVRSLQPPYPVAYLRNGVKKIYLDTSVLKKGGRKYLEDSFS